MPGSSAQVGTPSAILRPQDLPPSPDPLVDLSALVVRMHTLLANPALGSAVPYPALELLARPQSERVYREKAVTPLRNGEIDAVSRAGTGVWQGTDKRPMSLRRWLRIGTGVWRDPTPSRARTL